MLVGPAVEEVERLAKGMIRCHVGGQGHRLLALVVVEAVGGRHLLDRSQRREAHHLAIGRFQVDAAEIRDAVELLLVSAQVDVILLAPVHIGGLAHPAQHRLQGAGDGGNRNAELAGAVARDGHLQLRSLLGVVEIRAYHQAARLRRFLQLQPLLVEFGIVVALQHELHRSGRAAPEARLEGADHHVGNNRQLGAERTGKLGGGHITLGPVGELDDHHAGLIAAAAKGGGY